MLYACMRNAGYITRNKIYIPQIQGVHKILLSYSKYCQWIRQISPFLLCPARLHCFEPHDPMMESIKLQLITVTN